MNRHLLFELAYMFYKIGTSVIHGERRLVKKSGKFCLFNSPSKWGLRNLAQSLLHDLSSHSFPRRFHQPTFSMYNGRTDPVEHVSQFKQKMAVHSQDETLLCRVFPSNLGPMPMRWFDGLRTNSISSFKKLTQLFCSRFITCSRVPQPLDSLLSDRKSVV